MEQTKEGPPGSNEAKTLQSDINKLGRGIGALTDLDQLLTKTPREKHPRILEQMTGVTKR